MNTGLGLSFLRFVNEEGSNGWAQVYARIPFDDVELKTKGALLGAVFGRETRNWADVEAELTAWVDEYFNGSAVAGDLSGFLNGFCDKYPKLDGVWIWITVGVNNKRELKLTKLGEAGVVLNRQGKEFDLTKNLEEGKVIKGGLEEGDGLTLWTPFLPDSDESNMEVERAVARLVLKIDKFEGLPTDIKTEPAVIPVIAELVQENNQELVSDRYVGPIRLKEKLWNLWKQLGTRDQTHLVIKRDLPRRKRWAGLLGMIFLLLLVVSIVMGSLKLKGEAETKRWRNFSEPIEKSVQEALDLSKINPGGAKKIMEEARINFEAKKSDFINGRYKKDLVELEKKLNDSWTLTSGEKESQIEELVNLDLVRSGLKGSRLNLIKSNQFLVLDNVMGVVATAETRTKDVRVVAGKGEGQGWIDVVGDGKGVLVMNKSGIMVPGKEPVIVFDSAVVDPVATGRFMNNIYVLDKGNKEIFKYGAIGEGFGDRSRWLKQGQSIVTAPVDMAIDSDIWIVGENGQVEKYRRGVKEQFLLSGLPPEIKVSRLAVESSGDKIALLDIHSGTVVICNKVNGNCTQQLKSSRLTTATDIEFDESGNLLVLLPGMVALLR